MKISGCHPGYKRENVSARHHRAFSLVELITVIAIITVLAALMAPSFSAYSGTAGRRAAVNTIMNTLEQSRVAALESGRDVYVVFWRRDFPEQDAIAVFREPEVASAQLEQISKWANLPKTILLFKPSSGSNIFTSTLPTGLASQLHFPGSATTPQDSALALVKFSSSGTVMHPSSDLLLFLAEGIRENGEDAPRRAEANDPFEIISIAKYTGRPTLEVTAIPN